MPGPEKSTVPLLQDDRKYAGTGVAPAPGNTAVPMMVWLCAVPRVSVTKVGLFALLESAIDRTSLVPGSKVTLEAERVPFGLPTVLLSS